MERKGRRMMGGCAVTVSMLMTAGALTLASASCASDASSDDEPNDSSSAELTGTGLRGEYFDNRDLTALKVTRVDPTVDFSWDRGAPDPSIGPDTFSVRWTGRVIARSSETYRFYTTSDDGVRLWVNGQLLVDNWTEHYPVENSGTIRLTKGVLYDIRMEFYENTGLATAKLSWSSPSTSKRIIPATRLFPPAAGGPVDAGAPPDAAVPDSGSPADGGSPPPGNDAGGACSGNPGTPGGPDGNGGCFPGPNNTGPNAPESTMPAYTGSCTITAANTVIDSKVINCKPLVVSGSASGLVVSNSYLKGGIVQSGGAASFTLQDSFLDNAVAYPACSGGTCPAGLYACGDPNNATVDCGVTGSNFTVRRTEIINTNRAAYCESNCTLEDNYFHGTNLWPDRTNLAHASSVRVEQNVTLRHNTLWCSFEGPFTNDEIGCSADISGYPDFAPIKNNTIDRNLLMSNNIGAGFCAYGGGTQTKPFSNDPTNDTNVVFKNNVFQRGANGKCGSYGPVTDFISGRTGNAWSNNTWDTGGVVDPG